MNNLPFFLALVKKNVILWTIITSGSFASVDLKKTDHHLRSDFWLDLYNYSISKDDTFEDIDIIFARQYTELAFYTTDAKYLENTNYFFRTNVFNGLNFEETQQALNTLGEFTNIQPIEMAKDTIVKVEIQHFQKNRYRILLFFNLRNAMRDYAPQLDEKIRKELKKDSR